MFYGTITLDAYHIQLDTIVAKNGWSHHKNARILAIKMRVYATEVLHNVPPEHRGTVLFWRVSWLACGSPGKTWLQYQRLRSRRPELGETYQNIDATGERLALVSLPWMPQETVVVIGTEAYVEAIRDPEVKCLVRFGRRDSVRAAMVPAIKGDISLRAMRC